jgi:chemosensory pili system protein ChpC
MSDELQTVRCQLIPLSKDLVIVPSIAIAEVVNYSGIVDSSQDDREWQLGNVMWRGLEVPLISLDAMNEGASHAHENLNDARVIILNCDPQLAGVNYIGCLSHGLPHLTMLSRDNIKVVSSDSHSSDLASCYIAMSTEQSEGAVYVLDLPLLQKRYSEQVSQ